MTSQSKETKAQRVERLKVEKNPWDALDEIRAFAREGRAGVLPEWASLYFKWWGIYTQGDGAGVLGGQGGEGKANEYFMLRIGLRNGRVDARQLRAIAEISRRYGRNLADITVRQSIQLHWLPIEAIPEAIDLLDSVGLSPKGACGDVVRNVTGCPVAGVAEDEIFDASPIARAAARLLAGNPDFYNLPRKFKISITGCPVWCSFPEINDVALTAVRRGKEAGFSVRVGGGLSADPHLAVRLNAFVPVPQAVDVVRGVTEIFREQQGLREHRERARLKHLFLREGWTAENFLDELQSRLGFKLDPAAEEIVPSGEGRDHVGVHPQRQPNLFYVGAAISRGRVTGDQLNAAAELADRFGNGELRTTVMQNLIVLNVPKHNLDVLIRELKNINLRVEGSPFWRGAITCTGTEFCKLAITETKEFARWLVEELEIRMPAFDQQLKLHITGCPNSCGQHWIADIGMEGKKIKRGGALVDAYYFCLGGGLGAHAGVARPVGYRCPASEIPDALERLLTGYLMERRGEEDLQSFFRRSSNEELRSLLAGEIIPAVERDIAHDRVPAGVAG
ncbi:MAG: nitrite/sulfite reductase [Acidobacteriota bacterium]|nr:nitrite/sulfite reductase [Acidobacteriota bacterium]